MGESTSGSSPPPRSIDTIFSTPVSTTRSPATGTEVQILRSVHAIESNRLTNNGEGLPDSMEFVFKLRHPTSFFDETFNDFEVGILTRLEALGVV